MYGKCRVIRKDLFSIADRLKAIDEGYFVVYNYKKRKFQVHNSRQYGDTYCLTLPFSSLDSRAIDLVYRTKAENSRDIFEKMERDNARLMKKEVDCAVRNIANWREN